MSLTDNSIIESLHHFGHDSDKTYSENRNTKETYVSDYDFPSMHIGFRKVSARHCF